MTEELEIVDDDGFDDEDDDDEEETEEGGLGGFDLGGLLAQAQTMQQQLVEAQARVASQQVEGQAGGGVVRVRMTGGFEFTSVTIDPSAVDPDDVELLEDLITAAITDAMDKAAKLAEEKMGALTGGMKIPGLM